MDAECRYGPGDRAYVNGEEVQVVRQVLYNRAAYRVRSLRGQNRAPCLEWVVDGTYLSDDPESRVGLVGSVGRRRGDAA